MLVIGCNVVGHLAAGLVELQRIGDDTTGRGWERTRKMGVNTLAFRANQHNAFFAADADCVGLTPESPWDLNRQWLDLLARSGTPLFVSADPTVIGAEQRAALKQAFTIAAEPRPTGEPLDWLFSTAPSYWRFGDDSVHYDWYGERGVRVLDPV
jgi:alpha-galactosidase